MSQETKTRAVVVYHKEDVRVEDRVLSEPARDEAMVRIAFGGVCGSDLHYWQHGAAGLSILREPMVLGHEVVGTVLRAAADGSGPEVGTRVAVHPATEIAGDEPYPADSPNLSPRGTYLGSAAHFPHTQGAFADVAVLPARMLRPLPEGLDLRLAALAEPASVAWHAVARSGGVAGKNVLVIGAGPIGALIVAVCKRAGAASITAVDLAEVPLEVARQVGADRVLKAPSASDLAEVHADVTFESSGSARGLDSALTGTRRGGEVVMVGLLPAGEQPVQIAKAISRELRLSGSFRFNAEMDEVLAALADGSLAVDPIITHVYPADEALAAFATARDSSQSSKVLLDFQD